MVVAFIFLLLAAGGVVGNVYAQHVTQAKQCKQNQGRTCTEHELEHPYLQTPAVPLPLPAVHHLYTEDVLIHARFGLHYKPWEWPNCRVINPALSVLNGSIWAVFRFQLGSPVFDDVHVGDPLCPINSLHDLEPCPPDFRDTIKYGNAYSFISYVQLNSEFRPTSEVRALDLHGKGHHEDPRAFTWDSDIFVIFNEPRTAKEFGIANSMAIRRILPTVGPVIELKLENRHRIEKNWAPIGSSSNGGYLFVYDIDMAFTVVECSREGDCVRLVTTDKHNRKLRELQKRYRLDRFHLGSNAVRLSEDEYGASFHGRHAYRDADGKIRIDNLIFAYKFEAKYPWHITAIGKKPLELPTPEHLHYKPSSSMRVIYLCGMQFVDGNLVLEYSVMAISNSFLVTSVDAVFGNMDLV